MFPQFWVGNLMISTSLFCHPIHILPHKLDSACNIESKIYSKSNNCPKKALKLHDEIVETQSSFINYT